MVQTDTLEGIIDEVLHFHYDVSSDVLYLRLLSAMETMTIGDLTDEGDILLRDEITDQAVGLTVVNWWKRFGHGALPDSIAEIQKQIEPLAKKVAA
jgi:hypothetical protein